MTELCDCGAVLRSGDTVVTDHRCEPLFRLLTREEYNGIRELKYSIFNEVPAIVRRLADRIDELERKLEEKETKP